MSDNLKEEKIILPDTSKLIVSNSPHIHNPQRVEKIMRDVIIALLPAIAVGILFFGFSGFKVIIYSTFFCLLIEAICLKLLDKKLAILTDGSAIITGLLLGMNLAAGTPWWVCLIGAILAIALTKQLFGGLGYNLFNPALVGRVGLLIAFPTYLTTWPVNHYSAFAEKFKATIAALKDGSTTLKIIAESKEWTAAQFKALEESFINGTINLDAVTCATPLTLDGVSGATSTNLVNFPAITNFDLFLGTINGCIGEVSAAALLLGGIYLLWRKVITWHIPVFFILTVFIIASGMHFYNPKQYASPLYQILSGGVFLGAIFMATDMVTSPVSKKGAIIFAIGCGLVASVIRLFGSYPEGVSFAILFMNAFVPLIDRYTQPKIFGGNLNKGVK